MRTPPRKESLPLLLLVNVQLTMVFLSGGAVPNHSWGRKGSTPAHRLAWHFPPHGARPVQALLCPNTHLHYMFQCEATHAGFANC